MQHIDSCKKERQYNLLATFGTTRQGFYFRLFF